MAHVIRRVLYAIRAPSELRAVQEAIRDALGTAPDLPPTFVADVRRLPNNPVWTVNEIRTGGTVEHYAVSLLATEAYRELATGRHHRSRGELTAHGTALLAFIAACLDTMTAKGYTTPAGTENFRERVRRTAGAGAAPWP